jgi:hypothetical protein
MQSASYAMSHALTSQLVSGNENEGLVKSMSELSRWGVRGHASVVQVSPVVANRSAQSKGFAWRL